MTLKHDFEYLTALCLESRVMSTSTISETEWQYSEECMCHLRNIAMCNYQKSVTSGQTDRQTPDKVIPMCCYASQTTKKENIKEF